MRTTFLRLLGSIVLAAGIILPLLRAEDRKPVPRVMPNPAYPFEMSKAGVQGAVEVEFIINASGDVVDVRAVRSTNRAFEIPALQAVQKWKFVPGEKGGKRVSVRAQQVVEFNLDIPPVYPLELLQRKVEGSASVDVVIDAAGHATSTELIDATEPAFGRAAEAAVAFGSYAPALPGKNGSRRVRIKEYFQLDGTGQAKISDSAKKILRLLDKKSAFVAEKELDGPLVVKTAPAPVFPARLAAEPGAGSAVVEAFIDEKGEVQLPRVVSAPREEFGWAAAQAISNWRYEPPKKNRKATLVRVQIPVEFSPAATATPAP